MITVFYARYAYLNPGWPRFLEFLTATPPPGIRAIDVTPCTPDEVGRLAAESSTIAIDQSIENASTWAGPGQFSIYRIRGNRPVGFFSEISDRLWSASARRVFLSNFDLHDVRLPGVLEKMRGRVDAFTWMFERKPLSFDEIPPQYRDSWMTDTSIAARNWALVRDVAPIRIELPFALAEDELAATPPRAVWDTCVPGARYATRAIANASVRASGLSSAPAYAIGRTLRGVSMLLGKTLPSEPASVASIALQQASQRAVVRASATSFVCGSGVAYATRKFFEVPGLLAPMLAYPCVGFEDYGFRDGENVAATLPEDTGTRVRWLRANSDRAAAMAHAAQALVRRAHLVPVRAAQFAECLQRLERGQLAGAIFREGRLEIS